MSIKFDCWIICMVIEYGMIELFQVGQVCVDVNGEKLIFYGVFSYGYDVCCVDEFKVFINIYLVIVDFKYFDEKSFVDIKGDYCIILFNFFVLVCIVEYFWILCSVLIICLGKFIYVCCGIIVNVMLLELEWEGYVILEFFNIINLFVCIYVYEGVVQMLFLEFDEECEIFYKDCGGKYQGQCGVMLLCI